MFVIRSRSFDLKILKGSSHIFLGGTMEALANLGSGVNWEALIQLTLVGLIMLSGPVVIFVLAFRGGDL
jgi:hypothetical protein